jgi:hypothetical protein
MMPMADNAIRVPSRSMQPGRIASSKLLPMPA